MEAALDSFHEFLGVLGGGAFAGQIVADGLAVMAQMPGDRGDRPALADSACASTTWAGNFSEQNGGDSPDRRQLVETTRRRLCLDRRSKIGSWRYRVVIVR